MYVGGLVVSKASTIYRDLAHRLIFTEGGGKCDIWDRFITSLILSRMRWKMQQDIRILKQKCNAAMIALCPGQVW